MKKTFNKVMSANKDLEEIKNKLENIKKYYEDISAKYSIKNDLVEITDKRHALAQTLSDELSEHSKNVDDIIKKVTTAIDEIEKLKIGLDNKVDVYNQFKEDVDALDTLLSFERVEGVKYKEELVSFLSEDNIDDLITKSEKIQSIWKDLSTENGVDRDIVHDILHMDDEIHSFVNKIFHPTSESDISIETKIDNYDTEITDKYKKIVTGYTKTNEENEEIEVKSFFDDISEKRKDLNGFHKKVFGTGTEEDIGLEKSLDNQLSRFKEIETEAKKIINLSSDAGLAGGFYQRGNKARGNKFISLALFGLSLILLAYFNFDTIKFDELDKITPTSIAIRLLINSPLVWLAIVANINLNKYARLEEEYAHKESLAKSFERYKEQVENLVDKDASNKLMEQLLETNINAFQKNAADTMVEAKSDMPMKDMGMKSVKSVES